MNVVFGRSRRKDWTERVTGGNEVYRTFNRPEHVESRTARTDFGELGLECSDKIMPSVNVAAQLHLSVGLIPFFIYQCIPGSSKEVLISNFDVG